jgi:hypothetical protein
MMTLARIVLTNVAPGFGSLMLLSRRIQLGRPDEFEHLVVELKRPSQKIDGNVAQQIQRYAAAVGKDERFGGAGFRASRDAAGGTGRGPSRCLCSGGLDVGPGYRALLRRLPFVNHLKWGVHDAREAFLDFSRVAARRPEELAARPHKVVKPADRA